MDAPATGHSTSPDALPPMTWIPAFAGMTGGKRAVCEFLVGLSLATSTGHPGEGRGPDRKAQSWTSALGSAFAGMTGGRRG